MKKMTSLEIRKMWLDFFSQKGHQIVPSAPLVPKDDDSLLWINAGVTPLKKYFDGTLVPDNRRLTNIQKCIRTNDIENVGVTRRHHTFFEMMGNFSIGDYFKNEAIEFAFELLTSKDWFAIPLDKLYFTLYPDDHEAYNKWRSLGVSDEHIVKLEDNFWEIGEGPCGPDSEIFFDRGEKYDYDGKALEHFKKGEDNERYVEIWNNVFSQFNAKEGVERSKYQELPSKNIDTGAGLERWACIFQDADSNFDTDLFLPIIREIEDLSGTLYDTSMPFKVIADHIRALTFALADGAFFDNVGRGYILRRLLRRSVRYGKKLGFTKPFMYKLVSAVVDNMKEIYPYLIDKEKDIEALIKEEEELFLKTLNEGEKRLGELMQDSKDKKISGEAVFKLYDTYGFPFELTLEILEENGYQTDKNEFLEYMNKQKELSKSNQKQQDSMQSQNELLLNYKEESTFVYEVYELKGKVITIIKDNKFQDSLTDEGYVVFDKTCFYATSGGEISDTGMIIGSDFKARVIDVFKAPNGEHIHKVKVLNGKIKKGLEASLLVDKERRLKIEANHSSVHILQLALQTLISKDIYQAGSYVSDNYLRFDFVYRGKITDLDLIKIEDFVNDYIKNDYKRVTEVKDIKDIDKNSVMALFTEKYKDKVRLVIINDSKELCGGCHVKSTKDIEHFAIISFENKGSNTYRITAATKNLIEANLLKAMKPYNDNIVKNIMKLKDIKAMALKDGIKLTANIKYESIKPTSYKDIVEIKKQDNDISEVIREETKKYQKLKTSKAHENIQEYENSITPLKDINLLLMKTSNEDMETLKNILDTLANKYENFFALIANINSDMATYIARSTSRLDASSIIKDIALKTNGNGGGSKTFARGNGHAITKIDKVFAEIKNGI